MGRPTSVLVFAIINIILACLGVIGLAFNVAMRLGALPVPTEGNPALELMESNSAYKLFTDVTQILGALGSIVLLASAIGLLAMKPWARLVTIAYAVYSILMTVLAGAINFVLLFQPMLEKTAGTSGPERVGAMAGVIMAAVMMALVAVYWLLAIFFMTRRHVVAAFEDQFSDEDDAGMVAGFPSNE